MAYGKKYTSNFYNFYKKYVEVEIYKQDYTTPVIPLRNTEVSIEVNYQDNNTPIIGTGCKVVVINEGSFASLEDLLTSTEKQFKCIIKYDGVTVFQGFSVCDLNEQQFLPWSRITLQFTDYLRRLEGHFIGTDNDQESSGSTSTFAVGSNTDLLTLVQGLVVPVGFGSAYELYVNSTLIENSMTTDGGVTTTFLPQTYVENNVYFSNSNTYDDIYAMINRTLNIFGAFIYSCGDKWIIERQEDILRDKNTSNWVKYSLYQTASTTASLKEEYNKQAGGFQYVDESQVLTYESGLHTLILNLKDKAYDSFVFNDYSLDMISINDVHPEPGTLQYRTWHKYTDVEILQAGFNYRDINSFVKWTYPNTLSDQGAFASMGLYYAFQVQFQASEEEPIVLNVSYKMAGELDLSTATKVSMNFAIRVDGGPYSGYYLGKFPAPPSGVMIDVLYPTLSVAAFNTTEIDVTTDIGKVWTANGSFNLTDAYSEDGNTFTSIWELLGKPSSQKFMIYFYPSTITMLNLFQQWNRVNWLGDVEVTITSQKIANKLTYYINEDFVRTEEIDIDFWDLNNVNYANGIMYGLGGMGNDAIGKTDLWTSEKCPVPQPLVDIYAKNKFRNYANTIHKLKARILHDGYMKPFSVLTDDNKPNISFVLQGYTWDLNNGIYDIVAEEYTAEDIVLDEEGDSGGASSGGGSGDPGIVPPVPTGLATVQNTPGSGIDVSWDISVGATSYIAQRMPYYNGVSWISAFKTVWEGAQTQTYDPIQLEATPPNAMRIEYRVLAKTTLQFSAYSSSDIIFWTP